MIKDFVDILDFTAEQLAGLLKRALADKALFAAGKLPASLPRKTLAMIFEKPSLRTRVSFEAAMSQLGGHAIYLTGADIGLPTREPVQDIARVLGRMCDALATRTFSHPFVRQLAAHCPRPVVNALTDESHPCQAMADLMTVMERVGELGGRTLAFIGDGNNVARSLAAACTRLGMHFVLAAPAAHELKESFVASLPVGQGAGSYRAVRDPRQAVAGADVVYTDTWVSMGQEDQKAARLKAFAGFQVNAELIRAAPRQVMVMHCLPAYRGCEITEEVFEAHAQTILEEAANRLHFQRTLLNVLIGEGGVG
ncbi:MAG: ornithine carbamoyltransferase [Phycisphaerae bacterium]|nr:ornithine carbamoyltransferase [Phycisphaerae bacterium]